MAALLKRQVFALVGHSRNVRSLERCAQRGAGVVPAICGRGALSRPSHCHASLAACRLSPVALSRSFGSSTTVDSRDVRMKQLFDSLSCGDGLISVEQLEERLHALLPGARFNADDLRKMVAFADTDQSGAVDWDEWRVLFDGLDDKDVSLTALAEFWLGKVGDVRSPEVIFDIVWRRLQEAGGGGDEGIRFPAELLWLGGAPGSGKGTCTPYVLKERGLTAPPIVMSDLLNSPAALKVKADGGLVGDLEVFSVLCEVLTSPEYRHGALVDGFPRSKTQVELLHLLYDRLAHLHGQFDGTELEKQFPRPRFRVVVLFVDEHESIQRQLKRGRDVMKHNQRVSEAQAKGEPKAHLLELMEVRDTDLHVGPAKRRYDTFVSETLESLTSLKEYFPFHVVSAQGSVEETAAAVAQEMRYQSSMELQEETYDAIHGIPTAEEISENGRQRLVQRLDGYAAKHMDLLKKVVQAIDIEFVPTLRRHALSGAATVKSQRSVFLQHAIAVDMAVDVLADRRFQVTAVPGDKRTVFHIKWRTPTLMGLTP